MFVGHASVVVNRYFWACSLQYLSKVMATLNKLTYVNVCALRGGHNYNYVGRITECAYNNNRKQTNKIYIKSKHNGKETKTIFLAFAFFTTNFTFRNVIIIIIERNIIIAF